MLIKPRGLANFVRKNDSIDISDGKGYLLFVTSKIYDLKTMLNPSRSRNYAGE